MWDFGPHLECTDTRVGGFLLSFTSLNPCKFNSLQARVDTPNT